MSRNSKKLDFEEGTRVLCLSDGREAKELAIDELKEKRFLEDLERLERSVDKGNIKLKEKVGERIGRLRACLKTQICSNHSEMV